MGQPEYISYSMANGKILGKITTMLGQTTEMAGKTTTVMAGKTTTVMVKRQQ